MSRFSSRLDRLIVLRAREEAERARRLREALQTAEEAGRVRAEAEEHLEQCQDQAAEATTSGPSPVGALRNLRQALEAAMDIVDAARSSDRTSQEKVTVSREAFGEARQERRVLERLREKKHETWKDEESRREQSQCDEVARQQWENREDP